MSQTTRRRLLKWGAGAVAGSLTAGVGTYGYARKIEPERLVVERVTISLPALPPALSGFKIAQLSDFHLYPHTQLPHIEAAVELANAQTPDLVVLTGDYVLERADAIFELMPALTALQAPWGIFAVLGNHDYWTDVAVVKEGFAQAKLPLLVNEGVSLGNGLFVAGVDDGMAGQPNLAKALADRPVDTSVTLVLAHEPDLANGIAEDKRVDLQLSGHSHGGQVRFPIIGAPVLPPLGQQYDIGLNRVQDLWVYTNRGIGVIAPPIRFNCPPEITILTLQAG